MTLFAPTAAMDEKKELQLLLTRDPVMRWGVATIVVALGGFLLWAVFAPLQEGVLADGAVVVDTEHKTVQHLEGGIVERLHVREGSEVEAGQLLIELSETRARAELERLESRYYGRMAEFDRLNAERLSRERIEFSEELLARRDEPRIATQLAVQEDLFEVRRNEYQGEVEILRHRVQQLEEQARGLEASQEARQREQALIEQDLENLEALRERQLVDEGLLIARQREYEQGLGAIGNNAADIAAARVAIGETRQQIIQLQNTLRTKVSDQLIAAQQELLETRERIVAVRDVLRRTRIRAPQDGKVIGLTAHTQGGVVQAGSPIMNIVPSQDRLMVEGRVRPTDIDNVFPGQEARLRFNSFSWRTTPELTGKVERVSPDAFQNRDTGQSYYVARILAPEEELAKLGEVEVEPGMPVSIMFTGGERTAWQYLAAPLSDILNKALVEE